MFAASFPPFHLPLPEQDRSAEAERQNTGADGGKQIRRFRRKVYPGVQTAVLFFALFTVVFHNRLYLLVRYLRISIAHAARMIAPLITYNMFAETERKFSPTNMSCSKSTPITMPLIFPVPPTKDTPPMTQAAIASLS